MKIHLCLLPLSIFIHFNKGCDEGLLFLGGEVEGGRVQEIHLLTKDGWCSNIDLPPLPSVLERPQAYFADYSQMSNPPPAEAAVVCGFHDSSPCRFAFPGDKEWSPMTGVPSFQRKNRETKDMDFDWPPAQFESTAMNPMMVKDTDNELIIMMNTNVIDSFTGGLMHNLPYSSVWSEKFPSEILLESEIGPYTKKNLTGSCFLKTPKGREFSKYDDEYLITGGRYQETAADMASRRTGSDSAVGRMSYHGAEEEGGCNYPGCGIPRWQSRVRPNMNEAREDHTCMGLLNAGKPSALVAGGLDFYWIYGNSGAASKSQFMTYNTLKSTELYNGTHWTFGPNLREPRTGAQMAEFCGDILVFGGKQMNGRYDWYADYILPEDSWSILEVDNVTIKYLDSVERLTYGFEGLFWSSAEFKLPQKMAHFALAKVHDASLLCKQANSLTDCSTEGLQPAGLCSNQFVRCTNGQAQVEFCEEGLVFNPATQACEQSVNVDTCN